MTDIENITALEEAANKASEEVLDLLLQSYSFDSAVLAACMATAALIVIEGDSEDSESTVESATLHVLRLIENRVKAITAGREA